MWDTVWWRVLTWVDGPQGAVESASLTTVEKDQSKQFPERDDDLLRSLQLLAAGESAHFMVREREREREKEVEETGV